MPPLNYEQLDDEAMDVLTARLAYHKGSRSALARELEFSRSGISQALDRNYPGNTARLRARIMERLSAMIACPHLEAEISPAACRAFRERPLTAASGSPSDVRHWQACRVCVANPLRDREGAR